MATLRKRKPPFRLSRREASLGRQPWKGPAWAVLFSAGTAEERIKGNETQPACRPQGHHPVSDLQLLVDVGEVEIHRSL